MTARDAALSWSVNATTESSSSGPNAASTAARAASVARPRPQRPGREQPGHLDLVVAAHVVRSSPDAPEHLACRPVAHQPGAEAMALPVVHVVHEHGAHLGRASAGRRGRPATASRPRAGRPARGAAPRRRGPAAGADEALGLDAVELHRCEASRSGRARLPTPASRSRPTPRACSRWTTPTRRTSRCRSTAPTRATMFDLDRESLAALRRRVRRSLRARPGLGAGRRPRLRRGRLGCAAPREPERRRVADAADAGALPAAARGRRRALVRAVGRGRLVAGDPRRRARPRGDARVDVPHRRRTPATSTSCARSSASRTPASTLCDIQLPTRTHAAARGGRDPGGGVRAAPPRRTAGLNLGNYPADFFQNAPIRGLDESFFYLHSGAVPLCRRGSSDRCTGRCIEVRKNHIVAALVAAGVPLALAGSAVAENPHATPPGQAKKQQATAAPETKPAKTKTTKTKAPKATKRQSAPKTAKRRPPRPRATATPARPPSVTRPGPRRTRT